MKRSIFKKIGNLLNFGSGASYSDKNDPRIMVPKEMPGMGYKLNFGNPVAVKSVIFAVVTVVAILIFYVLIFG